MNILVSHISALEYWRATGPRFLRADHARRAATDRARATFSEPCKPRLAGNGRRPAGCVLPLDVLVPNEDVRTTNAQVKSCLWGAALPDASFVDAGEGLLVSTPEFCFLQMASRLSLAQLIQLGFELCGTYAVQSDGPAVVRDAALTTVSKLRAFIESVPGSRGRKKAQRAVAYIQDGSASPMETLLTMMLCLPYALGGYGLEYPQLNYRIDIPKAMRKLADRTYCLCDLCWPLARLCVEYDSRLYHLDSDRQESDARRRATLSALGFVVVTVARGQVMDSGSFNRLAHQLAKLTGKRLRYRDPAFTHRHLELRKELMETLWEGER